MVALALLVLLGLGVAVLFAWAQRRQLTGPAPTALTSHPGVTILKPLKGVDPDLAANLATFFALDYPNYELLFGVDDPADPACTVARTLCAAHPHVQARVVISDHRIGFNPKVNNLAGILAHARHDIILISDSNVRVSPPYATELVSHLLQPGVGLVSSPFRGVRARGLGGALESLQLNTFVMGAVAAVEQVYGGVCVVGKSMMLRRETLEAIGGLAFLAQFLAEDQVCGEEVAALGLRVTVARTPVDNVLGKQPLRVFLSRHLRWAKIRWRMNPFAYTGELLLNSVFLACAGALIFPEGWAFATLVGALLVKSSLAAIAERTCAAGRPLFLYPPLILLKDLLIGITWAVPLVVATVVWRGNRLRIGPRSLLTPVAERTLHTLDQAVAEARG